MRPPDEVKRELVRQWLVKAEEDFSVARHLVSGKAPYLLTVGFHAQQAAEKFLKAFLVHHQIEFPKTHDLGELLDLVSEADAALAESLRTVTILNPYGVEARYPGDFPQLTQKDAAGAIELAARVRDAVRAALKGQV